MGYNIGDKLYFISTKEDDILFLGTIIINDFNIKYPEFLGIFHLTTDAAIDKYKLELFREFESKILELNNIKESEK